MSLLHLTSILCSSLETFPKIESFFRLRTSELNYVDYPLRGSENYLVRPLRLLHRFLTSPQLPPSYRLDRLFNPMPSKKQNPPTKQQLRNRQLLKAGSTDVKRTKTWVLT